MSGVKFWTRFIGLSLMFLAAVAAAAVGGSLR